MIQREWTYQDTNRQQHKIRLLHAPEKGYVVLLYNDTVLELELESHGSNVYNFYIGDELCYCKISKGKEGKYAYVFGLNRGVDSPINKKTKQRAKDHFWQKISLSVLFIVSFLLVIGFSFLGYQQYHKYQLREHGIDCFAKVVKIDAKENIVVLLFNGKKFTGMLKDVPSSLELGDAFHVRFLAGDTEKYSIDFGFPSPITAVRYDQ